MEKRFYRNGRLYANAVDHPGLDHDTIGSGELGAAISNAVVRIHTKHKGRGPTRAKTYVFDEVILTVMEEGTATVVRTLADAGDGELVQSIRSRLHAAIADELKTAVEELTQRRVRAVVSGSEMNMDIDCTVFLLEAADEPGHH